MIEQKLAEIEERLNAQEELIANLMLAYTEMATGLETIIAEVMYPRSDEEKTEFRNMMRRQHFEVLKQMQEMARGMEQSSPDPTESVEPMVGEQPSPGAVEQ